MTTAKQGLRIAAPKNAALAGASVETIAFADLKADQIIAELSDEQKASLASALVPSPAASEGEGDAKAAVAAERARTNAVMSSEHFAGREALATDLLATDLSAEQIVGALAKASKPEAKGNAADEDAADRQLMRDRLQGNNANLGNDDEDQSDADTKAKANNHGWAAIHEEIRAARA